MNDTNELILALRQCEKWFLEYAEIHQSKNKMDKYEVNLRKAVFCNDIASKFTSDNSDYAVHHTDSPKLPSLEDVKKKLYKDETIGYTDIELVYDTIRKLGNFA